MEQQEKYGEYAQSGAQATHAPVYEKAPVPPDSDAAYAHKRKAQTGMILGIIGCVLMFYPLLSIAAVVLGALALHYKNEATQLAQQATIRENGMNTAAFATGLISVIGGALITLLYVLALVLFITVARVAITEIGGPAITSFFGYMDSML